MAVTKISRLSRYTLLICSAITVVVLGLYFFGGQVPEVDRLVDTKDEPAYTDALLYLSYGMTILTLVALVVFSIMNFVSTLMHNTKKGIKSIVVLGVFAILFIVAYNMGDGTPLKIVGYEGAYNVSSWLQATDMLLYTTYVLGALVILAILFSPILKLIKK